jgi:hypothetical protein
LELLEREMNQILRLKLEVQSQTQSHLLQVQLQMVSPPMRLLMSLGIRMKCRLSPVLQIRNLVPSLY